MTRTTLAQVLDRSNVLQASIDALFEKIEIVASAREELIFASYDVAREHANSLRLLVEFGSGTSAISLLRLQFEAVTRAMWLVWVASDEWIEKLSAPLSIDAQRIAERLPLLGAMVSEIEVHAPTGASSMLRHFKDVHWKPLNSYVHAGIHPLANVRTGYSPRLLTQVTQNSNALVTMAAMLIAVCAHDDSIIQTVKSFQLQFQDCLPPLERPS